MPLQTRFGTTTRAGGRTAAGGRRAATAGTCGRTTTGTANTGTATTWKRRRGGTVLSWNAGDYYWAAATAWHSTRTGDGRALTGARIRHNDAGEARSTRSTRKSTAASRHAAARH